MGNATRHISPARRTIPGKSSELTVVIPCAGLAKRMKGEPKSLIEFQGNSIIDRQMHTIWQVYPKADIIVVGGYQINKLRKHLAPYPVRLIYNSDFDHTNVLHSISLGLLASISNNVMLMYGDLILDEHCLPKDLTVGSSKILVDSHDSFDDDEAGVIVSENKITSLSFGLTSKWAQIAYLTGTELELFKEICYDESTVRWFGYEGLNEVINRSGNFEASFTTGKIVEIDQQEDLEKAASLP